jgi:hypothetical protein
MEIGEEGLAALWVPCALASGIKLSRKPVTIKKITTLKSQAFACSSVFFIAPSILQADTTITVSMENAGSRRSLAQ